MRGLSTLTEILTRGKILNISPSNLRENIYILIFQSGDQANIDTDTYKKLQDLLVS